MNQTIEKFGYQQTVIREYEHWVVLLRPGQPTLASLVLAAKSEATAFGDLPSDAFAELAAVTAAIEEGLRSFVDYTKLNYLMLMMVDPHVHFHVIPRYDGSRRFDGRDYPDQGWPKTPDLSSAQALDADEIVKMRDALRAAWP